MSEKQSAVGIFITELDRQGIKYGYIEDGDASRYYLRISNDKVLPTEFSDKLVPALLDAIEELRKYERGAV